MTLLMIDEKKYDALMAEIKQLKEKLFNSLDTIGILDKEIKELKQELIDELGMEK